MEVPNGPRPPPCRSRSENKWAELVKGFHKVKASPRHSDGLVWDINLAQWVPPRRQATLTMCEIEVMIGLCSGLSTAEVAKTLNKSWKTVQTQHTSLKKKLCIKNDIQLGIYALASGFVDSHGFKVEFTGRGRYSNQDASGPAN